MIEVEYRERRIIMVNRKELASGIICDKQYLLHDTGNHPESAERLRSIYSFLSANGIFEETYRIEPYPAPPSIIEYVHTPSYRERVKRLSLKGGGMLDLDTPVSPQSYEIALLAAGGLLSAIDAIVEGKVKNALCLVRPPGHHALPDRGMGFCLFNNIAIAARYLQKNHHFEKIAIVDWDVHHGNGTQFTFYDDPTVYYFSIHQYPHYPGTGAESDTGSDKGRGFTMNVPCPPGTDGNTIRSIFSDRFIPAILEFNADFILISAGFDAHEDDPLAQLRLRATDYRKLTELLTCCAAEACNGYLISTLEGGYDLNALNNSVLQHLSALMEA